MASSTRKRAVITYDRKIKRFRDASGRFIPRERGLKSKYARTTYLRTIKKPKAPPRPPKPPKVKPIRVKPQPLRPVKKKPAPAKPRKAKKPAKPAAPKKPPRKLPKYLRSAVTVRGKPVPGQVLYSGLGKYGPAALAALLVKLMREGNTAFRFWYKLKADGFGYRRGDLLSTPTLIWADIARNKQYDEALQWLQDRFYSIPSYITYFWASKREAFARVEDLD